MPKRKKTAAQMTDKELEARIFPKPVLRELKRIAHEKDEKPKQKQRK